MLQDLTKGRLQEAIRFAKDVNKWKDTECCLFDNLRYLSTYANHAGKKTRCDLYVDFAPMSFSFMMNIKDKDGIWKKWFNGGLIFHGSIDGYGSGSSPTFSVCLTPTDGWSIHT